jgi:murein DD-endopeptidase MepM/ murein hydrolase activator NlpD
MPSPAPTRHPDAAPVSPDEFDLDGQVILIGFPLKEATRYRYRDNWLDPREGIAEDYNHAHARRGGRLLRAHDGIDIYARRGEPVVSPFDGLVIDPQIRWQPWDPERYGLAAVILSEEPTSDGYLALLTHLDRLWVEPGQRVRRGEVLGTIGATGNAEGGPPHLHFELRAPFALNWLQLGEERQVDAFNPYPSLVAADPKRSD